MSTQDEMKEFEEAMSRLRPAGMRLSAAKVAFEAGRAMGGRGVGMYRAATLVMGVGLAVSLWWRPQAGGRLVEPVSYAPVADAPVERAGGGEQPRGEIALTDYVQVRRAALEEAMAPPAWNQASAPEVRIMGVDFFGGQP